MNLRDGLIMVVVVGLLAGVFFLQGPNSTPTTQQEKVSSVSRKVGAEEGEIAPNLNLATLDGKSATLSQYKGKPTLITFWTTWCGVCKKELPFVQKAFERYGNDVNFMMVNVTTQDDEQKVSNYVKEHGYSFPVLLDKTGNGSHDYGIRGFPTTFILSSEGKVQLKRVGSMEPDELNKMLDKAIEKK